jgi:transposase InsO family protein
MACPTCAIWSRRKGRSGHQKDVQGLRARLCPYRYQVLAPDAGRERAPLFLRHYRSRKRWVVIEIYADQTESSSVDFLAKVNAACPARICKLLTDNGSQFTDRFTSKTKKMEPSGQHVFDRLCKQFHIEHRLIPPRHPQTNGMVERFNGRISDIVNQTRFGSASELESTLRNYVKTTTTSHSGR